MKFTEAQLEQAFISLIQEEEIAYFIGSSVRKIKFKGMAEPPSTYGNLVSEKVLLTEDLKNYLRAQYAPENMIENEIKSIVRDLERLPSSDLYESNKLIVKKVCDGFLLKRENLNQKDFYIQLFDYSDKGNNTHKIVNQSAIKSGYVTKPLWS